MEAAIPETIHRNITERLTAVAGYAVQEAYHLLQEVGVKFPERVQRFSAREVFSALQRVARPVKLFGRTEEHHFVVGGFGRETPLRTLGGQAIKVHSPENPDGRDPTVDDFIYIIKEQDRSPEIAMVNATIELNPQDSEGLSRYGIRFEETPQGRTYYFDRNNREYALTQAGAELLLALEHTKKHVVISTITKADFENILEILNISEDEYAQRPFFSVISSTFLDYLVVNSKVYNDNLKTLAQKGVPIFISDAPMAGLNGPLLTSHLAIQTTAEISAIITDLSRHVPLNRLRIIAAPGLYSGEMLVEQIGDGYESPYVLQGAMLAAQIWKSLGVPANISFASQNEFSVPDTQGERYYRIRYQIMDAITRIFPDTLFRHFQYNVWQKMLKVDFDAFPSVIGNWMQSNRILVSANLRKLIQNLEDQCQIPYAREKPFGTIFAYEDDTVELVRPRRAFEVGMTTEG